MFLNFTLGVLLKYVFYNKNQICLQKSPYNTAVIFVDNAGVDFVLGILPLARELIIQGTRVVLTANSLPALNDVTYHDLNMYCCRAAQHCPILKQAIANAQLITVENGQGGPCLDLTQLSPGNEENELLN